MLVAAGVTAWSLRAPSLRRSTTPTPTSLAVLPFKPLVVEARNKVLDSGWRAV